MNPWAGLTAQVLTQGSYLLYFALVCCVVLIPLTITKGGLSGQVAHLFNMPNTLGRTYMSILDGLILAVPALLVGTLTFVVINTILPSANVAIEVPPFVVTIGGYGGGVTLPPPAVPPAPAP
jgi:hypothetical protein